MPDALGEQLAFEQLPPPLGDRVNIETRDLCEVSISSPAEQHRLQTSEEPALALIQRAEKQYQGRLALVEREGAALLLFRGSADLMRQYLSRGSSVGGRGLASGGQALKSNLYRSIIISVT